MQNLDCKYIVGERNGKKHQPLKVFKMTEVLKGKVINMEDMIHG